MLIARCSAHCALLRHRAPIGTLPAAPLQSLKHHPDRVGEGGTAAFQRVQRAFEVRRAHGAKDVAAADVTRCTRACPTRGGLRARRACRVRRHAAYGYHPHAIAAAPPPQTLSDPEKRAAFDMGGDVKARKKGRGDDDGDDDDSEDEAEEHKQSLREEIERKYYPERYEYLPFGGASRSDGRGWWGAL